MMSEVLPYLLMITCMLIRVSSKEAKWTVRDTSPKLGQGLTLFCKVDNCTVHETKRWHGGSDDRVLMLNSGISTDKAKYSTSIEKNGFILTILNLTVKDLNVSYTCSCGFDLDKHMLYIEDIYKVDNLNKSTNGNNYVGTNYANNIYLYVIILLSIVILLFVVFVVVIIKSGGWKSLKDKFSSTPRTKSAADDNENVTDPKLQNTHGDSNPRQRSDLDGNLHGDELYQQTTESINKVTVADDNENVTDPILQTTHRDSNPRQSSDLDDNLHGNELLQQPQESINRVTDADDNQNVTDPLLQNTHVDSNPRRSSDDSLHGTELLQKPQESRAPDSPLPTAHIDIIQRQYSADSSLSIVDIDLILQQRSADSSLSFVDIDFIRRQSQGLSINRRPP